MSQDEVVAIVVVAESWQGEADVQVVTEQVPDQVGPELPITTTAFTDGSAKVLKATKIAIESTIGARNPRKLIERAILEERPSWALWNAQFGVFLRSSDARAPKRSRGSEEPRSRVAHCRQAQLELIWNANEKKRPLCSHTASCSRPYFL